MNTITFSNQIIEVLEYLCDKFGIVCDWTSDSVVPFAKQIAEHYIKWEITTSIVWCIFSVIVISLSVILIMRGIKVRNDRQHSDDDDGIGRIVIGSFLAVIGVVILMTQILDIVKCINFPELQVFEYVKRLLSSMQSNKY